MAEEKKNNSKGIKKFFKDFIGEIKKVTWPTVKDTFKGTGIVMVAIMVVGLFVFALDAGLFTLLSQIMNLSSQQ